MLWSEGWLQWGGIYKRRMHLVRSDSLEKMWSFYKFIHSYKMVWGPGNPKQNVIISQIAN